MRGLEFTNTTWSSNFRNRGDRLRSGAPGCGNAVKNDPRYFGRSACLEFRFRRMIFRFAFLCRKSVQAGSRRMSGHNKWSTIKHKKAAVDAKKGQLFSCLLYTSDAADE